MWKRNSLTIPVTLWINVSGRHFPGLQEKSNLVQVHRKEIKTSIKNYRLISLLPVFSKIFERLIFSFLFNYFMEKSFLQSVSQILHLVTHALHSCCQLHMKSIKVLIATHQLTRGEFFLIFWKPFINSGLRFYHSKWKHME